MTRSDKQRRAIFANIALGAGGALLARRAPSFIRSSYRAYGAHRFAQHMVRQGTVSKAAARTGVIGRKLTNTPSLERMLLHAKGQFNLESISRIGKVIVRQKVPPVPLKLRERTFLHLMSLQNKLHMHPVFKHIDPSSVFIKVESVMRHIK